MSNIEDILLASFEEIPREPKKSREAKALDDMKVLLDYLGKLTNGALTEAEKKQIRTQKEEYQESIEILRKKIRSMDAL